MHLKKYKHIHIKLRLPHGFKVLSSSPNHKNMMTFLQRFMKHVELVLSSHVLKMLTNKKENYWTEFSKC